MAISENNFYSIKVIIGREKIKKVILTSIIIYHKTVQILDYAFCTIGFKRQNIYFYFYSFRVLREYFIIPHNTFSQYNSSEL